MYDKIVMINIVVYKRYNLKYLIMEVNATIGEQRVRKSFNPNANPFIEDLKQQYADLIDKLESMKAEGKNGRCLSIAQTDLETSCMYAVKSLFA